MDVAQWVRAARAAGNMTQEALASALGLTKGNVSAWENGRHSPSIQQIASIVRITGHAMPAEMAATPTATTPVIAPPNDPSDRYEFATRVHGAVLSAGNGGTTWAHEEVDGSHAFTRDWLRRKRLNISQCRVLTVEGDSMQPELQDGYVVLIDLSDCHPIKSGKVYAISIEGEQRIKRLFRQADGSLLIRSDNPDKTRYPDELVAPMHLDRVRIIGRKRWHAGDDD